MPDPFSAAALGYHDNGYLPIPLPSGEKSPPPNGTPNDIKITRSQIKKWVRSGEYNVGTIVPDGVVVIDVDGDKPEAWRNFKLLQKQYGKLPRTWRVHRGNPKRFHLWFRIPKGHAWPGKLANGIDVIYRHYRYVVLPPSVHPSGSLYEWLHADGSPADFGEFPSLDELTKLPKKWIEAFADTEAYKVQKRASVDSRRWLRENGRGDLCSRTQKTLDLHRKKIADGATTGGMHDAMARAQTALLRDTLAGHTGVSKALSTLKRRFLTLADASGRRDMGEAEAEWRRALTRAIAKAAMTAPDEDDPCVGDLTVPSPNQPAKVARHLLNTKKDIESGIYKLRYWRGGWMAWKETHWEEIEKEAVQGWLYRKLEHAAYENHGGELISWAPNSARIGNVMDAMKAYSFLDNKTAPGTWLDMPDTNDNTIVCENGVLDVATYGLTELTPRLFNTVSVPFDYDSKAPRPKHWLKFLKQLWGDDRESIRALQEWFGYILSGRTDLQKLLFIVGPKRSGKGTIARVLEALVGEGNYASPTSAALTTNFGMQPLLNSSLAVISDARFGTNAKSAVLERLLSISGEDVMTVDVKYREPWTGHLPTRFMVLSNDLVRLNDPSGAFVSRLVILRHTKSFLGKEDINLTKRLQQELPGILNWALTGLTRLSKRGRFNEPASSQEIRTEIEDQTSPTGAFIRECCKHGGKVNISNLHMKYIEWCVRNGVRYPLDVQRFGGELRSILPDLRSRQRRVKGQRVKQYLGISIR